MQKKDVLFLPSHMTRLTGPAITRQWGTIMPLIGFGRLHSNAARQRLLLCAILKLIVEKPSPLL